MGHELKLLLYNVPAPPFSQPLIPLRTSPLLSAGICVCAMALAARISCIKSLDSQYSEATASELPWH